MSKFERNDICADGKPVTFRLQSHVVLIFRPGFQKEPVAGQNLVIGPKASFRCTDCLQVFGCTGGDELSLEQKKRIFSQNPGRRGVAIAQTAFKTFSLDMDETQDPVIPKLKTPS